MNGRKTRKSSPHPIGTPPGTAPNTGPLASASWLVARDLQPQPAKWFVTITFASETGAKLDLEILSEEWGFRLEHEGRVSWIRVTDIAFAHGLDQHQLLERTPKLKNIGALVREIAKTHGLDLAAPVVHTNLVEADAAIASWLRTL